MKSVIATNLNKASADLKKYQKEHEQSVQKTAALTQKLHTLRLEKQALENKIDVHRRSLAYYENVYKDLQKSLGISSQQKRNAEVVLEFNKKQVDVVFEKL